uniref:arylacetamide deacetylase-like 4 isoform X1 n=1 Tax=Jaculus jaculus TaxID=51337 RepID=UPI001E1B3495|nr:arylacetamide deacetylase-like 4 isoform X1 [Jaculus jaculus]
MAVLWLGLLGGLLAFPLGLFVWAVVRHLVTAEIPATIQHPVRLRFLHCMVLYVFAWGSILEKLRICSTPRLLQLLQDLGTIKKDPKLVVTDMRFGSIPVRLYQPKAASCKARRGIIFFHGGGAICGSLDSYHSLCSFLSRETDSVVLSVGYRKLPDYHHPVITQDCLNASIHFLKTLQTYGVDPSRVVMCGESVGGGAAAVVTQALLNRPNLPQLRAQVLICPPLQAINFFLPSFQQHQNVPFLTKDIMMLGVCKYLAIDRSWEDAILKGAGIPPDAWEKYKKWLSSENIPKRFRTQGLQPEFPGPFNEAAYLETRHVLDIENAPLLADDKVIAQLPEAFLVSYENDILRDDTLLYKKRLEDQGVPVTWCHVEDGFHGCILLFDKKPFCFPSSLRAINAVVSYINGI